MLPGPFFLYFGWIHCHWWSVWADISPIITPPLSYVVTVVVLLDVLKLVSPIFSIRMEKMQPIRAHDFTFWLAAIQYPFWYKNGDDQLVIIHSVNTTIVTREGVVPTIHTSYLSRAPRVYSCKFFLAGVNFYRFNAKNWHFRQILRKKVAFFFTDLTRKIGVFRCKFYSPKILPV